jgi:uncharacterized membrane protein
VLHTIRSTEAKRERETLDAVRSTQPQHNTRREKRNKQSEEEKAKAIRRTKCKAIVGFKFSSCLAGRICFVLFFAFFLHFIPSLLLLLVVILFSVLFLLLIARHAAKEGSCVEKDRC